MMRSLLVIILCSCISTVLASDLVREKRLAEEVEAGLVVGDAIYMKSDGHEFLAIYAESETDESKGTALILHGRGLHPNWSAVTAPLRIGLSEQGWNTLSIQLPVLHKEAKYYDYIPLFPDAISRIQTALDYLREEMEENNIVMIAHSCGVHMSMAYIEKSGDAGLSAYTGIGMGATDTGQPMQTPFAAMNIPVLDIFGSEDHGSVRKNAPVRLSGIEKNSKSKQMIIAGADHDFADESSTEKLLETVARWLDQVIVE